VMAVHHAPEMPECACGFSDRVVAQHMPRERIVTETHRCAFAVENFIAIGRSGAGDHQPQGIRARVNRGNVDGSGQFVYRQRCASAPEG
jgi:hypothetical protein